MMYFFHVFRIQDVLGYTASDVVGQSLYSFHHGVDSEILTECHQTRMYFSAVARWKALQCNNNNTCCIYELFNN
jgi:hypothetical protein